MLFYKRIIPFLWVIFGLFHFGCKSSQWQGQEAMQLVDTKSKRIEYQSKGVTKLANGISISNDFSGARMNKAELINDTVVITISAENYPINESPWYAFKIWSDVEINLNVKLFYKNEKHRYYPKISNDGVVWKLLPQEQYHAGEIEQADNPWQQPNTVTLELSLAPDTLWVAAQQVVTQREVDNWIDSLSTKADIRVIDFSLSILAPKIGIYEIGNDSANNILFVLCRQHPPEVTGYLAMQAFINTICLQTALANNFRNNYKVVFIPLANPEGVELGHWRHNISGVDLNRDWLAFNQPETSTISAYADHLTENGGRIIAMLDFHSTWEDIFYTLHPDFKGNKPGLMLNLIAAMQREIPNYLPNIKPRTKDEARINSMTYFYFRHNAEAMVFEIGDNTPSQEIEQKGRVAAEQLMQLLLLD
jgi:hypothetical protein